MKPLSEYMKHIYLTTATLLLLLFSVNTELKASHAMGTDLQYECLGNNQYRITLRFYRDCGGIPAPTSPSIEVSAPGCGATFNINLAQTETQGVEVSQLCPAQIGQSECNFSPPSSAPYPGVRVYVYTGIVTLPSSCPNWRFRFTESARNPSNNLSSQPNLSIEAYVNNTIDPNTGQSYCNNSVEFSSVPVPFVCVGSLVNFNHTAVDADGDSLVYHLINPLGNAYAPIGFSTGWSVTQPVRTSPPGSFMFDSTTGQMTFTPAFQEVDVLAIRVDEYRNGVFIGSTIRDIQVTVLNCAVSIPETFQGGIINVQNGSKVDSVTVRVCPNSPLQFDILVTDPSFRNLTLTSTLNTNPSDIPGATFVQVGTGDTVIGRVNWTPQPSDTGRNTFVLIARNDDCPINGLLNKVYNILVDTEVKVVSSDSTFCGTAVQLVATGGSVFTWTPPVGLSNPNIFNPLASPTVSTWYYFTSDCGVDSVYVNVDPPFTVDAGPGGSICQNGLVRLDGYVDSLYAPYNIKWIPSLNKLFDPITHATADTMRILNPVASPLQTTTFTLSATGTNGCTRTDTVTVNVTNTGPNIVAKAYPTNVCPGDSVHLNILTNPEFCGVSTTPCQGNNYPGQLGTGIGVTPTGSPTTYPTIYGHYSNSSRHQFIYRASELLAQYPSGGEIRSISFYVAQVNTTNDTMQNFEIKMGCTQEQAFPMSSQTGWYNGAVPVYSASAVPVGSGPGWRTYNLTSPYNWDGTSNLIVEVCSYNTLSSTLNNKMQMTPTTYNSVFWTKSNTNVCGQTGTPASSMNRPNIKFDICIETVDSLPILWSPSAGVNAPRPNNIVNPVAFPMYPEIYEVAVTALNGCVSNDYVYIEVDTSALMSAFPDDTFFCFPSSFEITTTQSGAPLPGNTFTFQFTDLGTNTILYTGPISTLLVNPDTTTDYLVTMAGAACTLRDTVHVILPNRPPVTTFVIDSIDCYGNANAVVHASSSGSVAPYTYVWSTNATTDSITNVAPGTYSIVATDAIGCTGTDTVMVDEPTLLTFSAQASDVLCGGDSTGNVITTAAGGVPSYSYTWTPSLPDTSVASNVPAGQYDVIVSDANGCTASASATVSEPTPLSISTYSYNATSFGGNDGWGYVAASGGVTPYSYNWSSGATTDTASNLALGVYYVTVCDANLCCTIDSVVITNPPPVYLTFVTEDNPCFGDCLGKASVSATGGIEPYVFTWSANNYVGDSIMNLCNGTYTVTATDSAGVTVMGNVSITSPAQIATRLDTFDITCNGANDGSVIVTTTGGTPVYTYQWSPAGNSDTLSGLAAGTYDLTVTDANGCTAIDSWTAIEPAPLVLNIDNIVDVSCAGGSDGEADVSATGGTQPYSYTWSVANINSTVNNNLPSGLHQVTVTDAHNCTASVSFTIGEPVAVSVSVTSITNVSCNGGTDGAIDITASGGTISGTAYAYAWSNNLTTEDLSGVGSGGYTVTVSDDNSCSATASANITEPTAIQLTFTHTDPLCAGDNNGTASVSAYGGTSGYQYDWAHLPGTNDNSNLTGLTAGTYNVVVEDATSCTVSGSVTLNSPPSLMAQLVNKVEISCANTADGSVEANVSGGTPPINYYWSNGATTPAISNLPPATYNLTVTDNNGCDTVLTTNFVAPPLVSIALFNADSATCPRYSDGSIQISGIGGTPGNSVPYEYSIDGVSWQGSEYFTGLKAGVYQITIRDGRGCLKDTTVFIGEPVEPVLTVLPQDSTISLGESITLSSSLSSYFASDINYYIWSPNVGLDCADCPVTRTTPYNRIEYTLTVNYIADCSISQTVTVGVGTGEDFFIPTAFSPNGDGNNDIFEVYGVGLAKVNMRIFNRWGEKVYDVTNQWAGWDGTYKGALQPPGVYTYSIEGVYLDGSKKLRTGSITLIR